MWKCGNMSSLSSSSNSGCVEMWKYVFIVLIYVITLEVWKCGNMSSMSLSNNSGSVEMWKYVFLVFVSKLWKSGSVEMFLHCLYLLKGLVHDNAHV